MKKKWFVSLLIILTLAFAIVFFVYKNLRFSTQETEENKIPQWVRTMDKEMIHNTTDAHAKLDSLFQAQQQKQKLTLLDSIYYTHYKLNLTVDSGNEDSLSVYALHSVTYLDAVSNSDVNSKLCYSLSKYYRLLGDYTTSLNYGLKGIAYPNLTGLSLFNLYNTIGGIYFEINEFETAVSYFTKAYELALNRLSIKYTTIAMANIGNSYLMLGDYDQVEAHLLPAYNYHVLEKDTLNLAKNLTSQSRLALLKKDFPKAGSKIENAFELVGHTKDVVAKGLVYQHYGNYLLANKNYSKALNYYQTAYDYSKKSKNPRGCLNALYGLRDCNRYLDQYKLAYQYQQEHTHLQDSLYGIKARLRMEEVLWSKKLDSQKTETLILENKFKEEQKRKRIQILFFVIIAVSSCVFAFILYKNNRKKIALAQLAKQELEKRLVIEQDLKVLKEQEYKYSIELKNQELMALNLLVLSKNKFFNEVETMLSKENKDEKKIYSDLKSKIKSTRSQEKDWEKFKTVFEQTHPTFYTTINEKYAQLSKAEIRICSYIKIEMTNEEICGVLNINRDSLLKSRYRIRKKLNLEHDVNLDQFISTW